MMDKILSEKELLHPKQKAWGEWSFSMPKEQRTEKLAAVLKHDNFDTSVDAEHNNWQQLFLVNQEKLQTDGFDSQGNISAHAKSDSIMECDEISEVHEETKDDSNASDDIVIEDISSFLAGACNQAASKLSSSLDDARSDMMRIQSDLEKFNKDSVVSIMEKTWAELSSNDAKVCFCVPFISSVKMCPLFYKTIFLEWLSGNPTKRLNFPNKLSAMLSIDGEKVCRHLIAPALQIKSEDKNMLNTVLHFTLELMSCMTEKHWNLLLNVYVSTLAELDTWELQVLTTILEHASPLVDDLSVVVQLISSNSSQLTVFQSREFGLLLVALTSRLKSESKSLVPPLKLIADKLKGPLKFKVLKLLSDIRDVP